MVLRSEDAMLWADCILTAFVDEDPFYQARSISQVSCASPYAGQIFAQAVAYRDPEYSIGPMNYYGRWNSLGTAIIPNAGVGSTAYLPCTPGAGKGGWAWASTPGAGIYVEYWGSCL